MCATQSKIFHETKVGIEQRVKTLPNYDTSHTEKRGKSVERMARGPFWITRWDSFVHLCTDWWLLEILSWSLGAFCVCSIGIILGFYDGKVLPKSFFLGMNLNAYISVLSAIAKLALAVPLEEALGAQKYLWFSTEVPKRPLMDFERFEDAVRGPFGAIRLIWRIRTQSIAFLGAILVLLSLAMDPFFQQLVALPSRPTLENRSKAPRVVNFVNSNRQTQNNTVGVAAEATFDSIVSSFYRANRTIPELDTFCPSEECSWPVFETLSVCGQCEDLSRMLNFDCLSEQGDWRTDYVLANATSKERTVKSCGWFFNASSTQPLLMSGYSVDHNVSVSEALLSRQLNYRDPFNGQTYWNGDFLLGDIPTPIAHFAVVSSTDIESVYQNRTPEAYECALQWCAKTISASFSDGVYKERVFSIFTNDTRVPDPVDVVQTGDSIDWFYTQNISLTPPGQPTTFFVSNDTMLKSRFAVENWIPSFLTQANSSIAPVLRYWNTVPLALGGEIIESSYSDLWLKNGEIPHIIDDLATGMTNSLRNNELYAEIVFGSGVYETFIDIQWGYFAFPILVVVAILIFLIATISQTALKPVRKGSSLITLVHGLSAETKEVLQGVESMRDLKSRAKELFVHIDSAEGSSTLGIQRQYGEVLRTINS